MQAPLSTDVDAHVTLTATAAEGRSTLPAQGPATVFVDAVADVPTAQLIITDSADAGRVVSNGEGALRPRRRLGRDRRLGNPRSRYSTAGLPRDRLTTGTHTGWTHNGITYNLTYTYTPTNGTTNGTILVTIPDNLATLTAFKQSTITPAMWICCSP